MHILDIYSMVCYFAGLITLMINPLLWMLIRYQTVGSMKMYSSALQQGVIIDTICSLVFTLTQVEYQFIDGYIFYGSRTPFNFFEGKANCIHPIAYFTAMGMIYGVITSLATYRYQLICFRNQMSNKRMIGSYVMKLIMSILIMAWLFVDSKPIHDDPVMFSKFQQIPVWKGRAKTSHLCGVSNKAVGTWVYLIALMLVSIINITVMLFTSIRVILWLRKMSAKVQKSMLDVQRQLDFRLFVQCISPILISLGAIGAAVIVLFEINDTTYVIYYLLVIACMPVINALATILCVRSYRKAICCGITTRRFSVTKSAVPPSFVTSVHKI